MRFNSKAAACAINMALMSEPLPNPEPPAIYLGKTMIYKLPFYLNCSALINPHMAIIGMSGSGKSYLLKSYVVKAVLHNKARVLVIDWNDEYRELIEFLSGKILNFGKDFKINLMDVYSGSLSSVSNVTEFINGMIELDQNQKSALHGHLLELFSTNGVKNISALISRTKITDPLLSNRLLQLSGNPFFAEQTEFDMRTALDGVYSISLSMLRDSSQRAELVKFILRLVIDCMHRMEIGGEKQRVLVLDEAWRLLKNPEEIGILYREGRKYGISVISATQMASDINNEIVANAGCLALFRLQSEKDYDILESTGLISSSEKKILGTLGIGSCMAYLAYKDKATHQSKFYIERICGMEFGNLCFSGEPMKHRISYKKFLDITGRLIDPHQKERITSFASQNGKNIEVPSFVRLLEELGLDRPAIVCYLRELGIADISIVNAYESA